MYVDAHWFPLGRAASHHGCMTTNVVLTHWATDRSVHETAVRAARGAARTAVRGYVGYEERPARRMVRLEVARCGIALILPFGDSLDLSDGIGGARRCVGAVPVGSQVRP